MTADDPWEGLFPDDDEEYDEEDSEEEYDIEVCEACGEEERFDHTGHCVWCGYRGHWESGAESELEGVDDEVDGDDAASGSHSEDQGSLFYSGSDRDLGDHPMDLGEEPDRRWVYPPYAPPCANLNRAGNSHLNDGKFILCNRGVPYDMIEKFDVEYDRHYGICAKVDNGRGRLYFGWNLVVEDTDVDGTRCVNAALEEVRLEKPMWDIERRPRGAWRAYRQIQEGGPDDFRFGGEASDGEME